MGAQIEIFSFVKVRELPKNPILQIRPLKTQINNFFDLSVNPGSEIYNHVDWVVTLKVFSGRIRVSIKNLQNWDFEF